MLPGHCHAQKPYTEDELLPEEVCAGIVSVAGGTLSNESKI